MKFVFISSLLFLLLFVISPVSLSAQEDMPLETVTPTAVPMHVEYALPYPGLLPDSPLYFAKAIRDSFIGFIISAPNKKAEFSLLQADKSLQTAVLLMKKGKSRESVALSTLKRGSEYFEDAIIQVKEARSQKFVMNDVIDRLSLSAKKHQEVYRSMQQLMPSAQGELSSLQRKMSEFEKTVDAIRK